MRSKTWRPRTTPIPAMSAVVKTREAHVPEEPRGQSPRVMKRSHTAATMTTTYGSRETKPINDVKSVGRKN